MTPTEATLLHRHARRAYETLAVRHKHDEPNNLGVVTDRYSDSAHVLLGQVQGDLRALADRHGIKLGEIGPIIYRLTEARQKVALAAREVHAIATGTERESTVTIGEAISRLELEDEARS